MSEFNILKDGSLSVEGAKIIWTNFAGRPTKFNSAGGKRTFNLVLREDIARELLDDGWNVREVRPRNEGDDPIFVTEVTVGFGQYPPKVYLVDGVTKSMHKMDEDTISILDNIDIANVDVLVRPYNHGVLNSKGSTIKGYVKSLYVTQDNTDFNGKYAEYAVDRQEAMNEDEELPFN